MSNNLVFNPTNAVSNYQNQLLAPFSLKPSWRLSVVLSSSKSSRALSAAKRHIETKGVSSRLTIRFSSFRETNIGKNKCYRREPAIKAVKSYSENKYSDLYFKKHIRSSKIFSIFYSKLIVKKWISSITPLGGFEPDLNYFFLEVLKINISLPPVAGRV